MSEIESRVRALGLFLLRPIAPPVGVVLPFEFARILTAHWPTLSARSGAS